MHELFLHVLIKTQMLDLEFNPYFGLKIENRLDGNFTASSFIVV